MMYLVLLKVPFSLFRAELYHKTRTPPNPPPSAGERPVPQGAERLTDAAVRSKWPAEVCKATIIAEALIETTCILAASVPSDTSSRILSALTNSATTSLNIFSPSPTWALGTVLAIAGGLLRLQAYRELGRFFTFQISILKDHKLVTSGPFSVVRHPSYTGLLTLLWGSVIAAVAPGSWTRQVLIDSAIRDGLVSGPAWMSCARALGITVALLQLIPTIGAFDRTRREDEMLKREFGEQWDEWAQKTPYRLIPGIY